MHQIRRASSADDAAGLIAGPDPERSPDMSRI